MLSDFLIISAVAFEAKPTREMLDRHGVRYDYMEIGIGPVYAAKSAARLKETSEGKNVLYLGSAGSFAPFSAPYLVTADKVWWMPTAERMGLAKYMKDLYKSVEIPVTGHFDLPVKQILTSSSVSFNAGIEVALPERELLIENMEAYSVAEELMEGAKTVDIIMGITNGIGPDASKDWVRHFKSIAQLTADYLEKKLCH